MQNEPVDVSEEFARQQNHFFIGSKVAASGPETASGKIHWKGMALKQRVSYHQLTLEFEDYRVWWDTPPGVRGRAGVPLLALLRDPEDRAPPGRRQAGGLLRGHLAHAGSGAPDRRSLGDEWGRVVHDLRRPHGSVTITRTLCASSSGTHLAGS